MLTARVEQFATHFDGSMGAIAIGITTVVTAIVGMGSAIIGLGVKGSTINDVTTAFDRLAESAGTTGDALRGGLSAGVKGTIDDFDLMQSVSRLMSSGFKLNAKDALTMGEAARAMGKATGTDAAGGLATLSSALLTGRTRGLAMAGIVVDLKGAEEKFAKSIGVTASQLSAEGQLEAKRIGILEAVRTHVDRLGVSQLSFKEKFQQASVAIGDWFNRLEVAVAASPNVSRAWDAIGAALQKAFGGASQTLLDWTIRWVNRFADAVATYGPRIIQWVRDIVDWVKAVYAVVIAAWDRVPDWFKNIAKDAALAGGGVYVASKAFNVMGSDILGGTANIATMTSGFRDMNAMIKSSVAAVKEFGLVGALARLPLFTGLVSAASLSLAGIGLGALLAKRDMDAWFAVQENHIEATKSLTVIEELYRQQLPLTTEQLQLLTKAQEALNKARNIPGVTIPKTDFSAPNQVFDKNNNFVPIFPKGIVLETPEQKAVREAANAGNKRFFKDLSEGYAKAAEAYSKAGLKKQMEELQLNLAGVAKQGGFTAEGLAKASVELAKLSEQGAKINKLGIEIMMKSALDSIKTVMPYIAAANDDLRTDLEKSVDQFALVQIAVDATADDWNAAFDGMVAATAKANAPMDRFRAMTATIKTGVSGLSDVLKIGAVDLKAIEVAIPLTPLQKFRESMVQSMSILAQQFTGITGKFAQTASVIAQTWTALDKAGVTTGQKIAAWTAAAAQAFSVFAGSISKDSYRIESSMLSMGAAGAQMGGPWGAVVGAAAGLVMGLAGNTKEATKAMQAAQHAIIDLQQSTVATYGSFINASMYAKRFGIDLNVAMNEQGARQLEWAMDQLDQTVKALAADVDKYKLTVADMNTLGAWEKTNVDAKTLLDSYARLKAAGYDESKILKAMAADTNTWLNANLRAGVIIPAAMGPIIKDLILTGQLTEENARLMLGLGADTIPTLADITAAADRYGIKLDSLGPKVHQLQITETAGQILADWETLSKATTDLGPVFDGMGLKVQDLVTDAINSGAKLPAAMKPMIEEWVKAGRLTDENGVKLTDLTKLSFAEDLATMFETLIGKLDKLIEKLTGGGSDSVAGALTDLGNTTTHVPIVFDYTNNGKPPSEGNGDNTDTANMAGGGVIYASRGANILPFPGRPRGTDTVPVWTTPGERVLSVSQNRDYERGGSSTIVVEMSGREVARAVVPYIPGETRRLKVSH